MDTRRIAKEYRLSNCAQIAHERSESGLSVRDFCRSRGIQENTYYYWQRKLRKASANEQTPDQRQLPAPSGWAAVAEQTAESTTPDEAKTIPVEIGKFKVSVSAETDTELLVKTLKVLAELC
jgi:transposase-like protein